MAFLPEWLGQENREPVTQHKKCSNLSCREGQAIRETIQMLQNVIEIQKANFWKMPKTMKLSRKHTTVLTTWLADNVLVNRLEHSMLIWIVIERIKLVSNCNKTGIYTIQNKLRTYFENALTFQKFYQQSISTAFLVQISLTILTNGQ